MASSTERIRVRLPEKFDPARHMVPLMKKITDTHGEGFEVDSIEDGMAVATRQVAVTEVSHNIKSKTKEVRLPRSVKPTDGEKMSVKLADQHGDGWEMTKFEPYLGKAVLTQLSPETARCRGAAALALGVKPWEVQVTPRRDGGFDLELPRTYMPSKHDAKLEEVATGVVGRDGWYVAVNAQQLTASIIPSAPPTFPEGIAFPLTRLGKGSIDRTPFGMVLPDPGADAGDEISIDWTASAWALVAGTPGSGKTVTLNAIIADSLSNGSALAIVDDVSKAIDFEWARPFCRQGGWGCDSLEASVGTLGLIRDEGARRSKVLKELGISNWLDMPDGRRFQPILVIIDEVSALVVPDPVPKGIPKDHPLFLEIGERNLARAMIQSYMRKIIAELRFVGVRMVISTQATNANTGVDPGLRTLIGHKILQGVNPSKAARSQIFADESAVLNVPENVKSGGKRAKGVGVAALEADAPAVYKSYYATTDDYQTALRKLGIEESSNAEPSSRDINKYLPTLGDESEATAARRGAMKDPMAELMGDSGYDENGRPLKGAALAASQTRVLSNMASRA
ncbi:cell division protein FtsK [Paeniglutamicibacter antarcticus]|uniref:Cell division protein FtsK n=1 Tax=Arthrobacter terrae TaxID=2935737 RepID=A0A931G3N1_9MICC|nr:cell division protein FtsK [Arthrobacter terrae]MBG0738851.1 cell division protein FtsK [Arthrobacter terrae]